LHTMASWFCIFSYSIPPGILRHSHSADSTAASMGLPHAAIPYLARASGA
jgi:hypothetical protein